MPRPLPILSFLLALLPTLAQAQTTQPNPNPHHPTLASLSPAATDLLIGMNAADHLVAVSTFDQQPQVKNLPKAGDYQTFDWETLALVKPDLLIIQTAKIPDGLQQHADQLNVKILNLHIDRLTDIYNAIDQLGIAINDPTLANTLKSRLQSQFTQAGQTPPAPSPPKVLVVTDENCQYVLGPGSFGDDLLAAVHAQNAAQSIHSPYPQIDPQTLVSLNPDVIIQLLPNATPQQLDVAEQFKKSLPNLPAIKNNRVYVLTQSYVQLPGAHVGDLALQFSQFIYAPSPTPFSPPQPPSSIPKSWLYPASLALLALLFLLTTLLLTRRQNFNLKTLAITLAGCLLAWAAATSACYFLGSQGINWPTNPQLRHLRLEPILMASLVGAALASAGVVYQAVLKNPLADPYLLGVCSGASLTTFLWRFSFITPLLALGATSFALSQQAFAFTGALLAVAIVFALSQKRGKLDPLSLLLVGVIVNIINGSIFTLLQSLYPDTTFGSTTFSFFVGGIQSNLKYQDEIISTSLVATGFALLLYLAGQLNVTPLSEGEAQSLGIRIHRLRWTSLIIASLMTAAAMAVSGPIGFVGLICPHLARKIVGPDQRRLLPWSAALGASLLATADAGSKILLHTANTVFPVGVLTGLLGGPFFLLLLWQNRRNSESRHGAPL